MSHDQQTFTRVETFLHVQCPTANCDGGELLCLPELGEVVHELDPEKREPFHCRECQADSLMMLTTGRWYIARAEQPEPEGGGLPLGVADGAQCPECGSLTKVELSDGDGISDPGRELWCWCCSLEAKIVDRNDQRWARWAWPNKSVNGGKANAKAD